jgi:cyanophycin synthetase
MLLVDARRLTGPNHLARTPLVLAEVGLDPSESVAAALGAYSRELGRMREALGLAPEVRAITREHRGGAVFAYPAPIDEMLAHAEASEWAVLSAVETLAGRPALELEPTRTEIAQMLDEARSPRLLALAREAERRGLPLLWDDETVSVGMARRSASFPRGALPEIADVAWESLGVIPTALVTGTNGKTTSSRLLARMASEAGLTVGASSTSGVSIGGAVVEEGDWTGPAAARVVLRHREVDLAVLETARGGILRRGLAVDTCDVALVTNVSDDHLGLYGIDDLSAMVEVKAVVLQAVRREGTAVLSAHDPALVALGRALSCHVTFFADLDDADEAASGEARAVVLAHRAEGKRVVVARGGVITTAHGGAESELARVDELPITFGGAARYNVQNALGAVGAAEALGVPRDAIAQALRGFSMADNPGRGQLVERDGATLFLDFGHNPAGVHAVMQLVRSLHAARGGGKGKLTVIAGSPGDRSDQEIVDVARRLWDARPDRVLVRELGDYLRGRAAGAVPELYRTTLLSLGLPEASFGVVRSEVEGLELALADAAPGDFIAVLVHVDHAEVQAFLAR